MVDKSRGSSRGGEMEERQRKLVGKRIVEVIKLRGFSYQDVSDRMGLGYRRATIQKWSEGERGLHLAALFDLCRALRVSLYYITSGQGSPEETSNIFGVASQEGVPVEVLSMPGEDRKEKIYVNGGRDGQDKANPVTDASMAPLSRPGDMTFFRRDITPRHGDVVWVWNEESGQLLLREWRRVRKGGDMYPELHAFASEVAAEPVEDHHQVLGVVYKTVRTDDSVLKRPADFEPKLLPFEG